MICCHVFQFYICKMNALTKLKQVNSLVITMRANLDITYYRPVKNSLQTKDLTSGNGMDGQKVIFHPVGSTWRCTAL